MDRERKVSVILTSYNHRKYIAESIQSVLNQTFTDFELLIFDDGSQDDSQEIIRSFHDDRIRLFLFPENRGACVCIREVEHEARGKYVAMHHSDDVWEPEKLAREVAFLDNHSAEYGAVFSYAQIIDEDGNDFLQPDHFYSKVFVQKNRTRQEWLRRFFYEGNCLCHPSMLIRRECYEELGTYDPRFFQLPDLDFWIRLCLRWQIHILPEKLVRFRVHIDGSNASGGNVENVIRNNNEYLQLLQEYHGIATEEDFFQVFPQFSYLRTTKGFVLDYALAQVCLSADMNKVYHAFGLQLLYALLKDPLQVERVHEIYGYEPNQLDVWSKNTDIFGEAKVNLLKPRLQYVDEAGHVFDVQVSRARLQVGRVHVEASLPPEAAGCKVVLRPLSDWPVEFSRLEALLDGEAVPFAVEEQSVFSGDILSAELSPKLSIAADHVRPGQLRLSYAVRFMEWSGVMNRYIGELKTLEQDIRDIDEREKQYQRDITEQMRQKNELSAQLQQIRNSNGYHMLLRWYRLRDGIKRCKCAVTGVFSALGGIDEYKVKKFWLYLRTESPSRLFARIMNYFGRYEVMTTNVPQGKVPQKLDHYDKLILPETEHPVVSIVIPVYNKWEYTYDCLKQIIENTADVDYEVILADDVSSDETKDAAALVEHLVISRNEKNLGFLRNCNRAAGLARGTYIHFLNNDTNVQPGWLSSLVRLMEQRQDVGMAGSKLIYGDGRLQEAGGIVWKDGSAWNYGHLDGAMEPAYDYVKEVDYISGASILIRQSLWQEIGGFDERFVPAYYEDTDLAFAVRQAGYKVVLQPLSMVVHFEGVSNGTDVKQGIKRYQQVNFQKFLDKWRSVLETEHFPNAEDVFWARDRSRGQKTILVVDHYVPHYDCDAGGRCTYNYLRFFVQMGMHVLFVGDNYFRHEPYTTELQQLGIEVIAGDNWHIGRFEKWLSGNGKYIDFVYLNRPHISVKYIDMMKKLTQAKIFYFGHDLHFIREHRQYEIEKKPELLESAEKWKKIECSLFEKADVVHVVGSYEQGVLQEMFPDKPIRNIPLYLYDRAELEKLPQPSLEGRKTMIFVGGFNHQPNQDAIFWFMEHVYPRIIQELPELEFYVVGSHPTDEVLALANERIFVTGYVSDERLAELYAMSRVNVIPLRYGAGIKGKVIETMYFNVPAVTTTIGAEGLPGVEKCVEVVGEIDDAEGYAQKVLQYFQDDSIWLEHAQREQEYIREYFTTERAKEILEQDMF